MPKYIRTKDGIYEVESEFLDNEGKWIGYNIVGDDMTIILRIQVIKQSDNLAELCDEFVIDWLPTNHKDIFGIDEYSKKIIESCIGNSKTNVYGAIWTDKGLIYVAKMNDDGELVLI